MASNSVPSREDVGNVFAQLSKLVRAAMRPLPTQTGDYTYLPDTTKPSILDQLKTVTIRDIGTIKDLIVETVEGDPLDDKTYLMERVIQLASELPLGSTSSNDVTGLFLTQLWNDLKHPPLSYLGNDYIYRKADGSFNNILWPKIGAANTPYARSVKPVTLRPIALPDPGVVFDSVMVRKEFKEHPNKISSVLFYLASIIIHDLFRTNHGDFNISDTSSYLDLAPLYGSNQEEQDLMRTKKDGKIKPDCFSEKRILGFPPGVGVLLIMFNRFHNYVVEQLAVIDEGGRFSNIRHPARPPPAYDGEAEYDNALFQTGRLVTCGLYINCILKDYVRTILNMNRTTSRWDLDPRSDEGKTLFNPGAAEAGGNQVSAEFNLVYRWHSCVSQKDDKWTQEAFDLLFSNEKSRDLKTFLSKLYQWDHDLAKDPHARPFANLQRTSTGSFRDDDLAAIFVSSVEDPAGAFGANQVPAIFRNVEILGIIQARSWNLATLNEFRKFFNLAPHRKFEDINPDPKVAEQLKRLYEHPDYVELYPGLVVEEAKEKMTPGAGLCPGFTLSRAVLSDAVALVRGDRFYTVDYTPRQLTNFGFSEADYDVNVDYGHVMYKLVLRAFPKNFRPDSIYAHFPLVIPDENQKIFTGLKIANQYNFDKPQSQPDLTVIHSYATCKSIVMNKIDYKVTWGGDSIDRLVENGGQNYGQNFMLSGDGPANAKSRELMQPALYCPGWKVEVQKFYEDITLQLLHRNSYKIAGVNQVDIVRDVSNFAQVNFAASVFSLPLKTERNPLGIYSESEMYTILAACFTDVFYDADPAKSFPLRQASQTFAQQLGALVELNVQFVSRAGGIASILDRLHHHDELTDYGIHLIQQLLKRDSSVKDVVWTNIMPTVVSMVAVQSQIFCQCLDFYLLPENKPHLEKISALSQLNTPEADNSLLHYFLEGARLACSTGLIRQIAKDGQVTDNGTTVPLKAGHRLFCNLVEASRDPSVFPNPEKVDPNRDIDSYIHYGLGPHECLGKDLNMTAMTTMLKTVCKLKNLRRAVGPQGQLKKIPGPFGITLYMTEDQRSYFPFPSSMKVNWDGDIPVTTKK